MKNLKLAFLGIMSLLLVVGLSACGDGGSGKDDGKLNVAFVFSGYLGDKSFNDSTNLGAVKAAEEFGYNVKYFESDKSDEWETNFVAALEDDYDIVFAVSSQFQDIVAKYADSYPDENIVLLDAVVKKDNVESVIFAQNEGSFLTGAAAALWTQYDQIEGVNAESTIGWVGGMDIPVLHDFLVGYEQGAKYVNPDIKILTTFTGTFNDPLKGKEATLAQYDQGADIVMNVASNTGNGILEAANEQGKFAIGVDSDQDGIYPGAILTSMLKRLDVATYETMKAFAENKTFNGGEITVMNISNGGVSLTDMSVMQEALGDDFPVEIFEEIEALTEKVKSGEIKVESYPGFSVE